MSKTKKILLVDDDIDLIAMNRTVLEKNGYTVIEAYNGKEGIEKAKTELPDLIVLDVMMSTSSEGFDTARALRNQEETKNIPLLMLTSVNETVPFKYEPDETYLPVDRFLEKPLTPDKLISEIESMI